MKIALISITRNGVIISHRIKDGMQKHDCTVYSIDKFAGEGCVSFVSLSELTASIFKIFDALVFLTACGIAVRMISPFITSKLNDPAVIVVDEQGKFAISLLSGHIGGANFLTNEIVAIIGAIPVITTATDAGSRFSPDLFAKASSLHIVEFEAAKAIAAAVVDGKKIGLSTDYKYINLPPEFDLNGNCEEGISVSADINCSPFKTTLHLIPQNIILGVGCKRNILPDVFERIILDRLNKNNIQICRVTAVHTIDIKKDEPAIKQFCLKYNIPLCTFSAEQLMKANGRFDSSEFVLKTVGADNVCERSASLGGRIIIPKISGDGVTFAAAEKEILIDFGRKSE